MAEVAGLALGGLAVTSLLTSCIDILDYFHNGRYWLYDLGLVLTKVDLLKLRLTQLEAQLQLIPPAMEKADPLTIGCDDVVAALPVNDIDLAAMAQSGLSGVNAILQRTNHLCKRYSYGPITAASGKTPSGKSHTTTPKDAPSGWGKIHVAQADARQKQSPPPAVPSRGWQTLPRKVSWALCDKKRFDSLILDLDFLLSNLEKVVPPLPGTPSHESWGPLVRLGDYIDPSSAETMSQRTNSSSTLRHEPSRTARLPAEARNSHVVSPNHNSYAMRPARSHAAAATHTSPFTGSGQTLSGASVPAEPAPQPQTLQNHDVFKNNTVSDDSLVLRGGNIPEQGGGDPSSPQRPPVPMPIGTVHTEGNKISGSTVVQGPQTTTDLKLLLEYKLKMKQIPV